MNAAILNYKALVLSMLAVALPLSAFATPSATSPYVIDPQIAYVQDATPPHFRCI